MNLHPILFNDEMVRAILEGRKTQTRRPIKPQPVRSEVGNGLWVVKVDGKPGGMSCCNATEWDVRYWCGKWGRYEVGDRLWVRETFVLEETDELPTDGRAWQGLDECGEFGPYLVPHYRATEPEPHIVPDGLTDSYDDRTRWRPSIHMPRWASRIDLEVTGVRVARLQDITDEDAGEEGYPLTWARDPVSQLCVYWFRGQWDAIYADRGLGWEVNPWIFAISFKRIKS